MGFFGRLRAAFRALTLEDFKPLMLDSVSVAGVAVTERSALTFSAFWNAVDILSGQVAVRPRVLYRRVEGDTRERATSHPAYRVVHDEPNPDCTSFVFWQTLMMHALVVGNGYAEIEWDQAWRPIGLHLIAPGDITPVLVDGKDRGGRDVQRLAYVYKGRVPILAEDILHVPGLGWDGVRGYSVVQVARQSIALGLAAERFGAALFGNGTIPGLVLSADKRLDPEVRERLRESIRQFHEGTERAHRLLVTEGGLKVEKVSIPPEDAQFLETRVHQVEEIARWFNLPPHKLKSRTGNRPGGNIETQQIEFETDSLLPWCVRIEQECTRKLVPRAQRSTYYVEHLLDARSRAIPTGDRYKAYEIGRRGGWLSKNDVRRMENLPSIGPDGDRYDDASPAPGLGDGGGGRAAAQPRLIGAGGSDGALRALRALLVEVAGRFVRREGAAAKRAAKRGPEAFGVWAEEFYGREVEVLREMLEPAVACVQAARGVAGDARELAVQLARAHVARSSSELLELRASDLESAVEHLSARWDLSRALELAEWVMALQAPGGEE